MKTVTPIKSVKLGTLMCSVFKEEDDTATVKVSDNTHTYILNEGLKEHKAINFFNSLITHLRNPQIK